VENLQNNCKLDVSKVIINTAEWKEGEEPTYMDKETEELRQGNCSNVKERERGRGRGMMMGWQNS
jgi:hypothetical protein